MLLNKMIKAQILAMMTGSLVACGGGTESSVDSESSSSSVPVTNTAPVAEAGANQNVLLGQEVGLDASNSFDSDGDLLTYQWALASRPSGSSAGLNSVASVNPKFTPDVEGEYVFSLRVSDGSVQSSEDKVYVTVTRDNAAPVANAGADIDVWTQNSVTLDASASTDADGDTISYLWEFIYKPEGSQASLSDVSAVKPTFTPDVDGEYSIGLVVNDGTADSDLDSVLITSTKLNVAPVAVAGADREVHTYETVSLNGSESSDANGDTLTYLWRFVSKPNGSTASLTSETEKTASFVPDLEGAYTLSLVVNDGEAASVADSIVLNATRSNVAPVARGGLDHIQYGLADIALDGSASSDGDGDPITYNWTIQAKPSGSSLSISNPTDASVNLTPDVYGDYVFVLTATDSMGAVGTDNVTYEVRNPADRQDYLAQEISVYQSMSSSSSINGYIQAGSKYGLSVRNGNGQTIGWTKMEVSNANGTVFVRSTDSSVLSDGSLTASESGGVSFTLSTSQKSPFTATFYWTDPLDGDKAFTTTYEFANSLSGGYSSSSYSSSGGGYSSSSYSSYSGYSY